MKTKKITENITAVIILIVGFLSFFLTPIAERIYQKPIENEWQEIEEPFTASNFDLVFDNKGRDWFCTRDGVAVLDEGTWQIYNNENSGLPGGCNSIAIDTKDDVWVGTDSGLSVFDGQLWATYTVENSELLNNAICSINIDQMDRVWIIYCQRDAPAREISIYNGDEWNIVHIESIDGIPPIKDIYFDYTGTAWIQDGIIFSNDSKLHTVRNGEVELNVIPDSSITAMCSDEYGILWAIFRESHHYLYSYDGKSWVQERDLGYIPGGSNLACSREGHLAYGNDNRNLWIIHEESVYHYTHENSPLYYGLSALQYDHLGRLWIRDKRKTYLLSAEPQTPRPDWLVKIRDVTFHPNSMLVFSLLLISLGVAAWQRVVWVTATVIAIGLIRNALIGWQLRIIFGGTYVVLGVVGSLIGGWIQRRNGKGYALSMILAVVGMMIGFIIDYSFLLAIA